MEPLVTPPIGYPIQKIQDDLQNNLAQYQQHRADITLNGMREKIARPYQQALPDEKHEPMPRKSQDHVRLPDNWMKTATEEFKKSFPPTQEPDMSDSNMMKLFMQFMTKNEEDRSLVLPTIKHEPFHTFPMTSSANTSSNGSINHEPQTSHRKRGFQMPEEFQHLTKRQLYAHFIGKHSLEDGERPAKRPRTPTQPYPAHYEDRERTPPPHSQSFDMRERLDKRRAPLKAFHKSRPRGKFSPRRGQRGMSRHEDRRRDDDRSRAHPLDRMSPPRTYGDYRRDQPDYYNERDPRHRY